MLAIAPSANRRLATRSEVFPDWMPAVRPRKSPSDATFGVERRFTATPWLNSRYGCENSATAERSGVIVVPEMTASYCLREAVENPVEVAARVPHRLRGE